MIRIHVFVEGQTEETFLRDTVFPEFATKHIWLNAILVKTSSTGKGGVVSYGKIRRQIHQKLMEDTDAHVSTMFDLYRLPNDFPGMATSKNINTPLERACHLEAEMAKEINHHKFIPNLMVHEFEALLYSDPTKFREWFDEQTASAIEEQRNHFPTPEHINDGPDTAPSKRLLKTCRGYEKIMHGTNIASEIGLEKIRKECQHFDRWLTRLSNLT